MTSHHSLQDKLEAGLEDHLRSLKQECHSISTRTGRTPDRSVRILTQLNTAKDLDRSPPGVQGTSAAHLVAKVATNQPAEHPVVKEATNQPAAHLVAKSATNQPAAHQEQHIGNADQSRGKGSSNQISNLEASLIQLVTATDSTTQLVGVESRQPAQLADEDADTSALRVGYPDTIGLHGQQDEGPEPGTSPTPLRMIVIIIKEIIQHATHLWKMQTSARWSSHHLTQTIPENRAQQNTTP